MDADPINRLRGICMALPGATERLSHGEPTWFVGGKKTFVMLDNHHHGAEHLSFWCAAAPGAQEVLVGSAPGRFFRPPYVGHRGWLGVRIDVEDVDWEEIEALVVEAWRVVGGGKREGGKGKRDASAEHWR